MLKTHSGLLQLLVSWAVLTGTASLAHGAGWLDDFNDGSVTDGNPVTWLEDLGGSGFFPGRYDASSGDYVLDPDDFSPTGQMWALVPAMSFTDTYVRTQGMVLPDPNEPLNNSGNLVLTARINPANLTGYLVYFDVSGNVNLQVLEPGPGGPVSRDIGTAFGAPFNAASEIVLELNVVGDQLSAYVWLADDPNGKPAEPQVTATDSTYGSGITGIMFAEDDFGTSGVFRYVAGQDTPFVDALSGDFNGDSKVDAADYVVWRKSGGTSADYNTWRANFGRTAALGATEANTSAVPEPSSLFSCTLVMACLLRLTWR